VPNSSFFTKERHAPFLPYLSNDILVPYSACNLDSDTIASGRHGRAGYVKNRDYLASDSSLQDDGMLLTPASRLRTLPPLPTPPAISAAAASAAVVSAAVKGASPPVMIESAAIVKEPSAAAAPVPSEARNTRVALELNTKRTWQTLSADGNHGQRALAARAASGRRTLVNDCKDNQSDARGAKRHGSSSGKGAGGGASNHEWYAPLASKPALLHCLVFTIPSPVLCAPHSLFPQMSTRALPSLTSVWIHCSARSPDEIARGRPWRAGHTTNPKNHDRSAGDSSVLRTDVTPPTPASQLPTPRLLPSSSAAAAKGVVLAGSQFMTESASTLRKPTVATNSEGQPAVAMESASADASVTVVETLLTPSQNPERGTNVVGPAAQQQAAGAMTQQQQIHPTPVQPLDAEDPLPPGWSRHWSNTWKKFYWFHTKKNKQSWEPPKSGQPQSSSNDVKTASASAPDAPGVAIAPLLPDCPKPPAPVAAPVALASSGAAPEVPSAIAAMGSGWEAGSCGGCETVVPRVCNLEHTLTARHVTASSFAKA
jgi:hypothetical protein